VLLSITCIACITLDLPPRTIRLLCGGAQTRNNAECHGRVGASFSATCAISLVLLFLYIIIKASRRNN
jgi:hypothetical protein